LRTTGNRPFEEIQMSDNENNSSELSSNEPITQDAGLEAIMGMINPKDDLGEIENEPVAEAESEEEYSEEEVDENLDQLEEVETEDSDEGGEEELSGDIELEDGEYEYLVNAREYLNENGLDDIEKIKNGILMQGDYTRKTQALSEERNTFEAERGASLEETAKLLEYAQAMVYGQKPTHTTQELIALKQSDPYAYEQALENRVLYEQKEQEINAVAAQVHEQYEGQRLQNLQAESAKQAELLIQLEPSFSDQKVASQKVEVMTEYFESIGGSAEMLSTVTDAIVLKVLHDAAMANSTKKQVEATKKAPKKKASKTVLRKGASASRAQKQAAAQSKKFKNATQSDGSYSQSSAVDLILDSFK
jgi:hypothetical protein